MKVSRVSEMRELDRRAIEVYGIKDELLMENAGLALFSLIGKKMEIKGRRFCVFCGGGNNGGDGFVIARKLHSHGGSVKVFILGNEDRYEGPAGMNLSILRNLPVEIHGIDAPDAVRGDLAHTDAVVDAIFGTGLARAVEGRYKEVIEGINQSGKTVFSVDIPSGIHGNTGKVMGVAVRAHYTVTFGLPKIGGLLFPGYTHCGGLYVTHISFPPAMYEDPALKVEVNPVPQLPPRDPNGHKGDFGEALFIAGASTYYGAPYFAAQSFLKAGGGYSRLAAPRTMIPALAQKGSGIVFVPQQETASGSLALENKNGLSTLSEQMDMIVLGPGISLDRETQDLARALVRAVQKPILVDGDGLTAISKDPDILKARKQPTILTPHLGEMARLTGLTVSEIEADRIPVLQRTAEGLNAIIVLKGAHSLTGMPDGRVYINLSGNSGMATAGSGDVLTGTIAALYGLGLPLEEAVRGGVFVHGLSGDLAAETLGEDGLTAQDLVDTLPRALRTVREGLSGTLLKNLSGLQVL